MKNTEAPQRESRRFRQVTPTGRQSRTFTAMKADYSPGRQISPHLIERKKKQVFGFILGHGEQHKNGKTSPSPIRPGGVVVNEDVKRLNRVISDMTEEKNGMQLKIKSLEQRVRDLEAEKQRLEKFNSKIHSALQVQEYYNSQSKKKCEKLEHDLADMTKCY